MSADKSGRNKAGKRFVGVLVFIVICTVAVLSLTVFFKITEIRVEGDLEVYNAQQVVDNCGIKEGDNLFRFSRSAREKQLWKSMPYLSEVRIKRVLFGTVVIEVKESDFRLAMPYSGGCLILSEDLKILEISNAVPDGFTEIYGLDIKPPSVGTYVSTDAEDNREFLVNLLKALGDYGIVSEVSCINVRDKLNYSLIYQNRLYAVIGTGSNVDYKINMLKKAATEKLSETDTGTIDLSTAGRGIFKSKALEIDEAYKTPASITE